MLAAGTNIDRYVIQHSLGRGAMASVYCVKHQVLGTRHALKVLHRADPALHERLVREGRVQARLDPAYVVPVTDVLDVNGSPALLMPLVDGCSLAEMLEDYRPSETEVVVLFRAIVAGVANAHAAGVIHRDLKPANVLLEVTRGVVEVRVTDFGLARPEDDHGMTAAGVMMGTPAYAAPEQLADASVADHRADLWSLGVILVELLTGKRPFAAATLGALVAAVRRAEFDIDGIPAAWIGLVDELLEPDPALRLQSAEELRVALSSMAAPAVLHAGTSVAAVVGQRVDASRVRLAEMNAAADSGATLWTEETAAPVAVHNLPTERDAFVGRDRELATLHERLTSGARLVTLVGIGGSGKTRLVTRYGWRHLTDWPGGVWFCDLCDARDEVGIAHAVARTLDVPLSKDDFLVQLGHAIAGRGKCLVVLDNFEQVAVHARKTLGPWLDRASDAVFLVTTRELLGLPGEASQPLAPLKPSDSAALFLERAQWADPAFRTTASDTSAIEALVELLDHLPLAIELAASRVRVLPPKKLLARMSDRFRVLTSAGGRDGRQATLRATLNWSWELLAAWEQSALAQVSVFEGSFDLEAAEAVLDLSGFDEAPWAIDAMQALVDKSLVRAVSDNRFNLLVSVQEYAAERLSASGSRAAAEERHGLYFAGFGTPAAVDALDVHGGVARRRALARELDNLLIATRRAVAREDGAVAASTALAASAVMELAGPHRVAAALLEAALTSPGFDQHQAARAYVAVGRAWSLAGSIAKPPGYYDLALVAALDLDDRSLQGTVLGEISRLDYEQGRVEEARLRAEAALGLVREAGNRHAEGEIHGYLGNLHSERGSMGTAGRHFDLALAAHREVGDRRREGIVLGNLGALRQVEGHMDHARDCFEDALAIHREVGNRAFEAVVFRSLGILHRLQGSMRPARLHLEEALAVAREVGHRRLEGWVLGSLGTLHRVEGRVGEAREQLEAALSISIEVGNRGLQGSALASLGDLCRVEGRLKTAGARYDEALLIAREVGSRHLEGLVLGGLGRLRQTEGKLGEARAHYGAALASARDVGHERQEARMLSDLGLLDAREGRLDEAQRSLADAEARFRAIGDGLSLGEVLANHAEVNYKRADTDAAKIAFAQATDLAEQKSAGPDSDLGKRLTSVRTLLGME